MVDISVGLLLYQNSSLNRPNKGECYVDMGLHNGIMLQ